MSYAEGAREKWHTEDYQSSLVSPHCKREKQEEVETATAASGSGGGGSNNNHRRTHK